LEKGGIGKYTRRKVYEGDSEHIESKLSHKKEEEGEDLNQGCLRKDENIISQ